jgi:hypothetical protein
MIDEPGLLQVVEELAPALGELGPGQAGGGCDLVELDAGEAGGDDGFILLVGSPGHQGRGGGQAVEGG